MSLGHSLLCFCCKQQFQAAEERGEDYDRLQALVTQADLIERKEMAKRKKRPDKGFSGWSSF